MPIAKLLQRKLSLRKRLLARSTGYVTSVDTIHQ